jgi:hypothetical protein
MCISRRLKTRKTNICLSPVVCMAKEFITQWELDEICCFLLLSKLHATACNVVFIKRRYLPNFVTQMKCWLVFCKFLTWFLSVYLERFIRFLLIICYCYYRNVFFFKFSVSLFSLFSDPGCHSRYTGYVTDQTTEESCFSFRHGHQILLLPQPPDLLGAHEEFFSLGTEGSSRC